MTRQRDEKEQHMARGIERKAVIEVINKPSTVCNISERGDGYEEEALREREREMENF